MQHAQFIKQHFTAAKANSICYALKVLNMQQALHLFEDAQQRSATYVNSMLAALYNKRVTNVRYVYNAQTQQYVVA